MITEVKGVCRYPKNPRLISSIFLENRLFVTVGNAFYEVLSHEPAAIYLQYKSNLTPADSDIGYGIKSKSFGTTQ